MGKKLRGTSLRWFGHDVHAKNGAGGNFFSIYVNDPSRIRGRLKKTYENNYDRSKQK